jgi:penicillin-binding protein 2
MVREGLERVVEAGTATVAQIPGLKVAGKTGTAENPHGDDHSIFVAYAPVEDPRIAIAVVVENSGFGSRYAAPIASLMIEKYLNDTISTPRKFLEERMMTSTLIQ